VRHFISLADLDAAAVRSLLDEAVDLKMRLKADGPLRTMQGRLLGLIFEKPSTRTRFSFEAAMLELGGGSLFVDTSGGRLGAREPIKDLARVYSGYCAALALRTHAHETIEEMARFSDVPIINGLSDYNHPCQALADLLTMREVFGDLKDLVVAYIGDANNVTRSLALACERVGAHLRIAAPDGYQFSAEHVDELGCANAVTLLGDPVEAVSGADVVYADVWTSMGQEDETKARIEAFKGFQITSELMARAASRAIFMHCLPAHRGEEVEDAVIESGQSVVFQQAENRKHAQKAVLVRLLQD
jgi:ornithine carbamoyltransferase